MQQLSCNNKILKKSHPFNSRSCRWKKEKKKEGPSNEDAGCQIFLYLFLGGALAASVCHKRPTPLARFLRVRAYIKGAGLLRRTQ